MSFVVLYDTPRKPRPWWMAAGVTPVAAYQPKGAASLSPSSYINLANPGTFNAAPGTAPTWDNVNGWKFLMASSQYLTTGITPTGSYTIMARVSGVLAATAFIVGGSTGAAADLFQILPSTGATQRRYRNGATLTTAGEVASGTMAMAGKNCYLNGAADGTVGAGAMTTTRTIYIGAADNGGSAAGLGTGNIQAFIVFSSTIGAPGIAALHAAMMAL